MQRRQFGIVMMPQGDTITARNNRAGFNGSGNSQSSLYWGGQVGDIYYQVQGNTLLGDQVVTMAALAFTRASGTMADRVMAAMEAADQYGGDHRCNCGNDPLTHVAVRRQDRARRLHRHRRQGRRGRRHPQRRQVLRLPQRHRRRHQGRRERQPGEDAADALRRLEEGRRRADRAAGTDAVQAGALMSPTPVTISGGRNGCAGAYQNHTRFVPSPLRGAADPAEQRVMTGYAVVRVLAMTTGWAADGDRALPAALYGRVFALAPGSADPAEERLRLRDCCRRSARTGERLHRRAADCDALRQRRELADLAAPCFATTSPAGRHQEDGQRGGPTRSASEPKRPHRGAGRIAGGIEVAHRPRW